jgi:hypothetical protein
MPRPDDRRVALVALWPQSRSEAETEGTDRRTKESQEQLQVPIAIGRAIGICLG